MVELSSVEGRTQRGPLSERQQRILEFLREFIVDKDYPPSIRDIQQGCAISSTSVVDYNLKRLEERGYIRRDREVSRAIELLDGSGARRRSLTVPLVGTIAAGSPIPMPPETLPIGYDEVSVTEAQTRGRPSAFALRVKGTSMIDALIDDGDIVILEPTQSCDDGEMVAVWLREENETTLKKFFHEGAQVRLQPIQDGSNEPDIVPAAGAHAGVGRVVIARLAGRAARGDGMHEGHGLVSTRARAAATHRRPEHVVVAVAHQRHGREVGKIEVGAVEQQRQLLGGQRRGARLALGKALQIRLGEQGIAAHLLHFGIVENAQQPGGQRPIDHLREGLCGDLG